MTAFILVLFTLFTVINCQTFVPGKRAISSRSARALVAADVCTAGGQRFCNAECNGDGFWTCTGNKNGIEIKCGSEFKYCSDESNGNARCTKTPSGTCGSTGSTDHVCFEEGFFPNPENCHEFFQCYSEGGELKSDKFYCENYYVFDPSAPNNEYCRFTRNAYCLQVNCRGGFKNILMAYRYFPRAMGQLVTSCRGNDKPFVFRCKKGYIADLNSFPVDCKRDCTKSAKYAVAGNDTIYIECIYNGRGWEEKEKSCFRNYYFNDDESRCDPKPSTTTTTTPPPATAPTSPSKPGEIITTTTDKPLETTTEEDPSTLEEETSTLDDV